VKSLRALFSGHNALWNGAIIGSTAAVLLLNLAGLVAGITAVLPHLLYIPVVAAAYRYPRRGALFAAVIGGSYLILVIAIPGTSWIMVAEAVVRAGVMIVIGWLIAALTIRLREEETLYQGLFDHSEAGSMLIRTGGGTRRIEQANRKAAALLDTRSEDLSGTPLSSVWDGEETVFSGLPVNGGVFSGETIFFMPDRKKRHVLVSVAALPDGRAILTFVDITRRVAAEQASKTANDKLGLLSRISSDHLHRTLDRIIEAIDDAGASCTDTTPRSELERIRVLSWNLARQLLLTESYQELGSSPPVWNEVQRIFERIPVPDGARDISVRYWTERLGLYADPLFGEVLAHIAENSFRHGGKARNLVASYHETTDGLDLIIEDDGVGIPDGKKQQIFEYDAGGHAGIGLFICRQILEVTGMSIRETGIPGVGAQFVIHVPPGGYHIEGRDDESPPFPVPPDLPLPQIRGAWHRTGAIVRELLSAEFPIADTLWIDYHKITGDPRSDRIFAAFSDGQAVSVARCRCHPDGLEVDGVFTPEHYRGRGFAHAAVWGLVEACGRDPLFMHAVRHLGPFYSRYGFSPIDEKVLPDTIRERYAWAEGEMEGADVLPMMRLPSS
jgi:signal transduction histidine kinase